MRFFLVFSWRYAWEGGPMEARAVDDEALARDAARQYNGVLVEVSYDEGDLMPRVAAYDYEFRDDDGNPQPCRWMDIPGIWTGHGYIPLDSPVVRGGKDVRMDERQGDG